MKLYDYPGAPNPRRVRVFAAEKGVPLQSINVDLGAGEHKAPAFLAKNPSGKIPVLELEDGTCIGESVAICRYLEAVHPEPNLFGADPVELAQVEMHHRHVELELLGPIGTSWVNGPIVAKLLPVKPIVAARERSDAAVKAFYERLNLELTKRPYIAGERFTIADITALVAIDFATAMVELRPDASYEALWQWHSRVSERDSATA